MRPRAIFGVAVAALIGCGTSRISPISLPDEASPPIDTTEIDEPPAADEDTSTAVDPCAPLAQACSSDASQCEELEASECIPPCDAVDAACAAGEAVACQVSRERCSAEGCLMLESACTQGNPLACALLAACPSEADASETPPPTEDDTGDGESGTDPQEAPPTGDDTPPAPTCEQLERACEDGDTNACTLFAGQCAGGTTPTCEQFQAACAAGDAMGCQMHAALCSS